MKESVSLVPVSPLTNLPESSRKKLDASHIFSLQKTNGFNFIVADKAIVTKLVELEDIEVVKDGIRVREMCDQWLCFPTMLEVWGEGEEENYKGVGA